MKKLFLFAFSLVAAATVSATQYCDTPLTSTDGSATISLSCEKVGSIYQITVKGENLNGFGGSFFNPGATDLRNTIVSSSSTEIVCQIATEEAPSLYTPLYVLMPGEKVFAWPADVEWGTCGGGVEDSEAPVMVSASLVSVTHNAAVLAVEATDNQGVVTYHVVDAARSFDKSLPAAAGQLTLSGLAAGTAYSFVITAKDAAGNESANSKTVDLTTEEFSYCDAPTGHLGDANFGDPNGRCLLTLAKVDDNTVRVTLKPNTAAGATSLLDFLYVDYKLGAPCTAGADIEEGAGEAEMSVDVVYAEGIPATMNFTIQWSHPAWGGRWSMDVNDVTESVLCGDAVTTLVATPAVQPEAVKFIENGQLIILRDGVRYTAQGAKL